MSSTITTTLKNYLCSDYESDRNEKYGLGSLKGRLISLIDIPSQVGKGIVFTSSFLVIALLHAGCGGLHVTFKCVPKAIMSILPGTDHDYWSDLKAIEWSQAKRSFSRSLKTTVNACLCFVIHSTLMVSDITGCTFSPKIGRRLRRNYHKENCLTDTQKFLKKSTISLWA